MSTLYLGIMNSCRYLRKEILHNERKNVRKEGVGIRKVDYIFAGSRCDDVFPIFCECRMVPSVVEESECCINI